MCVHCGPLNDLKISIVLIHFRWKGTGVFEISLPKLKNIKKSNKNISNKMGENRNDNTAQKCRSIVYRLNAPLHTT